MVKKIRILFVCVENSFRSQIAESIMKKKYSDKFEVESAGLEPGVINEWEIRVMSEYGIDISENKTNSVFDYYKEGRLYSYIITVCSKEEEERCPVFPGIRQRIHWGFDNPIDFSGTDKEKYENAIHLRNMIEKRIDNFVLGLLE